MASQNPENSATNVRATLYVPSFKKLMNTKPSNHTPKHHNAYISELINVQSLLNIRSIQSQQRRFHTDPSFEDRIIINVSGDRYETHRNTLEIYPDTLLGNQRKRKHYYDKTRNEYFFDRNRSSFEAILYYYQSHGRLRRPNYVPIDVFLEEVTFFQLGQEALNQLRKDENIKEVQKIRLPKNRFRRHLWATMEYPDYSLAARIISIISLLTILLSTVVLAVESLPQYRNISQGLCDQKDIGGILLRDNTSDNTENSDNATAIENYFCDTYISSPFFTIQTVCIGLFTLELIARIISVPSFIDFISNIMNWIDLSAIVPYYILVAIYIADNRSLIGSKTYYGLRILRMFRFTRVLKFYRVFRGIKSLRALTSTIRESLLDFFVMINILTLLGFLFGAAAYFAENDTNQDSFDSIFKATYWGIITITSVGFGDVSPITPAGRIIACICALCGATTIGMLVSILVDRYQRVFARKLYINEDVINFAEFSDDDSNDVESECNSSAQPRHRFSKLFGSFDSKAKTNPAYVTETTAETPPPSPLPSSQITTEDSTTENNSVRFIIGYVDGENQDTSRDLIETISDVVARKQSQGDTIRLSIINSNGEQSQSDGVKFKVSLSSDDELDNDDDEELTEITDSHNTKGNVLMRFHSPESP